MSVSALYYNEEVEIEERIFDIFKRKQRYEFIMEKEKTIKIDKRIKWFLIYVIIISVALIVLNFIRAAKTGLSYDESYTYVHYVFSNPFKSFKYLFNSEEVLANNHLINSFAISFLDRIFHTHYNAFIIRLPNLLSYIIYLLFAYLIAKNYRHQFLCFNILAFNLGVHEMFGIGRGYGIACAFVIVALFFLLKWQKDPNDYKYLDLTYFILMISCYANTVCLMVFASVIIYTQLYLLINKGIKENINYLLKRWFIILPIAILTLIIIHYHFKVSGEGLPLFGGTSSFFENVLVSLVNIYGIEYNKTLCTVLLLIALGILIIVYRKKLYKDYLAYIAAIYFVLLILLTTVFNQMWLTARLLIPAVPLVSLSILEIIDNVSWKMVTVCLFVITIIPFVRHFNLYEAREIKNDYIIEKLAYEAYETKNNEKMKEHLLHGSTNFYRNKILEENGYDIFEGILDGESSNDNDLVEKNEIVN